MGKHVLIIDQSKTIQILLATCFRKAGHLAIPLSSPQEALHGLEVIQDIPDLIFIMVDPDGSAVEFIRKITSSTKYAHTQIVAMVLQEEKARIQRALNTRTIRYLMKPFTIQEVSAIVAGITQRR